MLPFRQEAQRLAADWGIHLPGVTHYATEPHSLSAMDDASGTRPLPGIPDVLTTTIDPQVVRELVTPTRRNRYMVAAKKATAHDGPCCSGGGKRRLRGALWGL